MLAARGPASFPWFLAEVKVCLCVYRGRGGGGGGESGGLWPAVRADLFTGPSKGVPGLQTNFTSFASPASSAPSGREPREAQGLESVGSRLPSTSVSLPLPHSFCSFLSEKKKKILMDRVKFLRRCPSYRGLPSWPPPVRRRCVWCVFLCYLRSGWGAPVGARAGVRPREQAPADAFGRDSSLPRGSGEVLATVP